MNAFIKGAAAAAALNFMVLGGAEAQLTAGAPACGMGTVVFEAGGGFDDCGGSFLGNNAGPEEADVLTFINDTWGLGVTSGSTTDADDPSGAGPFAPFEGEMTSGTLMFDHAVSGDFVVALKAANRFSLYLFTGRASGDELTFNTNGVTQDPVKALSHATLYGGTIEVSEPSTLLLLGAGILGLGFTTLRRREGSLPS